LQNENNFRVSLNTSINQNNQNINDLQNNKSNREEFHVEIENSNNLDQNVGITESLVNQNNIFSRNEDLISAPNSVSEELHHERFNNITENNYPIEENQDLYQEEKEREIQTLNIQQDPYFNQEEEEGENQILELDDEIEENKDLGRNNTIEENQEQEDLETLIDVDNEDEFEDEEEENFNFEIEKDENILEERIAIININNNISEEIIIDNHKRYILEKVKFFLIFKGTKT
jgi:hypothetical protein